MNRIESYLQSRVSNITGIKPESTNVKWYALAIMALSADLDRWINKTEFEGDLLPEKGPALVVVGPHSSWWDIPKGIAMGQRSHRLIRAYARHDLLGLEAEEPEEVKERIKQETEALNTNKGSNRWKNKIAEICKPVFKYIWKKAGKPLLASILNGVEAIPVSREGNEDQVLDFLDRGAAEFRKKHLVGILPQGHRHKDGKLSSLKEGAAALAMENSHILIYVAYMNKRRVSVKRLGSVDNLLDDPKTSRLAENNLTVLMFDTIADLAGQSDPDIKEDWYKVQRPALLPSSLSEQIPL